MVVNRSRAGAGGGGAARQRMVCHQNQRRAPRGRRGAASRELFFEIAEDELAPLGGQPRRVSSQNGEAGRARVAHFVSSRRFEAVGHRGEGAVGLAQRRSPAGRSA